jgi:formyltetrahydrofolate deformylase
VPVPVVLLISCPDRPGVVAATAEFIVAQGGNILHAEQHVDTGGPDGRPLFFQRIEFVIEGAEPSPDELEERIAPMAAEFGMTVDVRRSGAAVATGILASRQPHCLYDLLSRWRSGELPMDLRVVVSNHPDHHDICAHFGVPFAHHPTVSTTGEAGRDEQERRVLDTLERHGVELVVMARYMQILSDRFIGRYESRIINIHHSFLPAFVGANPYRQAHDRGVKLIGATAHYATNDLDEGPIIEQDTVHVSHRDDVARLTSKGRDLETVVLARAVRAHVEHRVIVAGGKTVVFS